MMGELRCEVCGRLRPFKEISVASARAVVLDVPVTRNVNHCWDDIDCADKARGKAQDLANRMADL